MINTDNYEFIETNCQDKEIYPRCLHIREVVFQGEQRVPKEIEYSGEEGCVHYLLKVDGKDAATSRFRLKKDEYKLERIAVLKEFRGKGVGKLLIDCFIKSIAKHRDNRKGTEKIMTHAQIAALDFWKKVNFIEYGEQFEEGGIQHYHMYYDESKLN